MYVLKEICCVTISIPVIYFFYGCVIISGEHLKQYIYQRRLLYYFTTLVVAILYNPWSVFDSRKYEEYFYLRKAIVAVLL